MKGVNACVHGCTDKGVVSIHPILLNPPTHRPPTGDSGCLSLVVTVMALLSSPLGGTGGEIPEVDWVKVLQGMSYAFSSLWDCP